MKSAKTSEVIVARDLTLGYKNNIIVSHINLIIEHGEFIGILGPNGAGKSTFLRALLGLLKPLAGELLVLGDAPTRGHRQIGYMPQLRHHLTAANLSSRNLIEIAFHGTRFGLPILSAEDKEQIQQVLELVKAQSYADRPFKQLSGGERQCVFLAQALLRKPKILLLDEPLASLDPRHQESFINLLYDVQRELKVTILFTAHDPNPLINVMTRVLYFAQGKAAIGTISDIITTEKLSTLYGTPIEVIHYKNRLVVLGEDHSIHQREAHHD